MKSTAQHTHSDGTVCWYDFTEAIAGWWTQLPEGYEDPEHPPTMLEDGTTMHDPAARFPTQNVPCPDPWDPQAVGTEIGDREVPLVAGDAPHEPGDLDSP